MVIAVNSFDYHAPTSLEETFELMEKYGEDAHLMAGGTALVLLLQQGLVQPGHVVGLRRVGQLNGIRRLDNGGLEIRALRGHTALITSVSPPWPKTLLAWPPSAFVTRAPLAATWRTPIRRRTPRQC